MLECITIVHRLAAHDIHARTQRLLPVGITSRYWLGREPKVLLINQMQSRTKTLGVVPLQAVCVLGHLANDWAPAAVWLLAPAIGLAFDLKPSQVGLLLSLHAVGASLAYFPAGILADRVRHQGRLLLTTFWWVTLGYLLASQAPGFWSLAVLLAFAGMGDAAWHPIATGVLVRQMPDRRGQALGIHAVGGTLAEVLSPLLVGFLLSVLDWQTVLQISVVPTALMGIAFFVLVNRVPQRHASTAISRADLLDFVRQWSAPRRLCLIGGLAAYNMALFALMTMSPLYAQRSLGLSPALTGAAFAAAMLLGSVGQPIVGRLSDRSGRLGIFVIGTVLAAALASTALFSVSPLATIALLTGAMGVLVAIRSCVLAMAVDHAGQREATALGFVYVMLDGVGALGAALAGLVGDFGLHYSFFFAATLSLVSAVVVTIAIRNRSDKTRM